MINYYQIKYSLIDGNQRCIDYASREKLLDSKEAIKKIVNFENLEQIANKWRDIKFLSSGIAYVDTGKSFGKTYFAVGDKTLKEGRDNLDLQIKIEYFETDPFVSDLKNFKISMVNQYLIDHNLKGFSIM